MAILCNSYQGYQHYTRNNTQRNNRYGNGFHNAAEGHGKPGPGKCSSADKEHGRIADQQKISAVLQQGCPKPGAMMFVVPIKYITDNKRKHTNSHQSK